MTISDCIFESNFAQSFGGGIYLLLGESVIIHQEILVQRTRIDSNIGQVGGGGVAAGFTNTEPPEKPLVMTFIDCEIRNNTGTAGGGISVASITGMCLILNAIFLFALSSLSVLRWGRKPLSSEKYLLHW